MHILAHELNRRGHDARIASLGRWAPSPFEAPADDDLAREAWNVYPDIVAGAPGAGPAIRWFLNHQRYPTGADDMLAGWDEPFIPATGSRLRVPVIDCATFNPARAAHRRAGVAVWAGKATALGRVPRGAIRITKTWPEHRIELAELLGSIEYLVSFDDCTALTHEATLCGTPVVLADVGIVRGSLERGYGIAPTLTEAQATVTDAWPHYIDNVLPAIERDVDDLIERTVGP